MNNSSDSKETPESTGECSDSSSDHAPQLESLVGNSWQIGPYRLLQEIGVGGMGAVWMAEQEKPVRRRVALKLIKSGRSDRATIGRFEAERQALSMMDHPNIARVLDAGTSVGGTPYFVMELVHGEPINKYCDRHRLSLRERLELFLPICDAIQHAHQKGIIHRDLKPSNVLVHVEGGQPVAKVIDFGLAKALEHQTKLTDKTIYTEFGQIIGTVQYMSPEQARTDAVDIDTRTDIYSLGVILYELLAGSTPLAAEEGTKNEVLRLLELVRKQEPPRPSRRVGDSSASKNEIGEQRQITATRLEQVLRGDLDWIVMKALEKDRTRRFATATEFAEDIRRYLDGDIVTARPPTSGYLLRKFIRKNRALVASTVACLLLLTCGIVGTLSFAWKANSALAETELARVEAESARVDAESARVEADSARTAAEVAADRAEEVLAILTGAFTSVDPERFAAADADMAAKDVLLNAQKALDDSPLDDEGRFALYQNLTDCFVSLGEYDCAISTGTNAVQLGEVLGEDHPETLKALNDLADAYYRAGRREEALPLQERALEVRRAILGEDHKETLVSMANLSKTYEKIGKLDKSLAMKEEVVRLCKLKLGPHHEQTVSSMNILAQGYELAGRDSEALEIFEQILDVAKSKRGPEHPQTLALMNNLAVAYENAGKLSNALFLKEETLRLCKKHFGEDHPNTLIVTNGVAVAYQKAHRFEEALELHHLTYEKSKAKLGADHPSTLLYLANAALVYELTGRLEEAQKTREQLLPTAIEKLGDTHYDTIKYKHDAARTYRKQGHLEDSARLYEQALEGRRATLGKEHPATIVTLTSLALTYELAGRFEEAAELLAEGVEVRGRQAADEWDYFDVLAQYGGVLLELDQTEAAAEHLVKGYEGMEGLSSEVTPTGARRTADVLKRLIQLAEKQQRPEDASKWQQKLVALTLSVGTYWR